MPRIQYRNEAGKRVPGVTTIAGAYKGDIGGLMRWANLGGQDGKSLDEMYDTSTVPGTLVHQMIEDTLRGVSTDFSEYTNDQRSLAESAYINWLTWWEQNDVVPIAIEPNLVSDELQCGGTPDLVATIHGKKCLVDWKSGKPLAYTSTLLQLAAYDMMVEECLGIKLEGFYIVIIPRKDETPTFTVNFRESMPELAREQFRLLRDAYDNEKALKKLL